jgi:hypothetical protein
MLRRSFLLIALFFSLFTSFSQGWTFVKEKEGVLLYTRREKGDEMKSYKGVVDFRSTVDRVAALIGDVHNNNWWGEDLREVKVLSDEDPNHFRYYLVYELSWPLSDRDLVVDARATHDPVTHAYMITSKSIEGLVPEQKDLVRIKSYWQKWTVLPLEKGMVQVSLEGSADPSGNIPSWLVNSAITDTPYKILLEVRKRCCE